MADDQLDPAILGALPKGCKVIAVKESKLAGWSPRYSVEVVVDGEEKEYFLKIIDRPSHAEMAQGEYESQKALEQHLPDNVAIPLAWGTLELDPSKSFYLTPFLNLSDEVPKPSQLAEVLQELHKTSPSPTGKFGFHVPTFNGVAPQVNGWCDSWEEYFSRQFRSDILWEQSIRGPDHEFDQLVEDFCQKVIPRLLRPLQTGGRTIKPVLVHGDVWHGNAQTDNATKRLILFDACCIYAHNEFELHMMRDARYRFTSNGEYKMEYLKIIPPSEPVEDFDDRNALYAIIKDEMCRLLAKHPKGIDGFNDELPN